MLTELFASDLATTTVSSGGTTAPSGGTQETWTVASSALFGAAATGISQFHVADAASGKGTEIIAVTNVSGTTWTVTRGAESTTPVAHAPGFTIYQVVTAGALGGMLQSADNLSDVASASSARTNLGLGSAATIATPVSTGNGGTGSAARNFAGLLTPTAVKTTTYTAAAGDYVPCNTTSGSFTVTLPNAPADLTVVGVKQVIQGGTNTVTVACAGSDVFNKTGGATSATLTLLAQGLLLQYKASGGIWYVLADDLPLSQLDIRYEGPAPSADTTGAADTAAIQTLINTAAAASGGVVQLRAGTYYVTGLTMKSLVYLKGAGIEATILQLATGANADVIQGQNFSSLTLTGANTWGSSGIWDFGISEMTVDGNRANQSGTSYGVRVYGYQWTFTNLSVRNCLSSGIWTEWGPLPSDAPVTSNGSESTGTNVRVFWNNIHGWMHLGPSDCRLTEVIIFKNNQNAGAAGIGFWALQDQLSNICLTASGMNGTSASGFTGTFTVQAAVLGGATDLYASSGTLAVTTSSGAATMTYTGKTATTFTGCTVTSGAGTFQTGNAVITSGTHKFVTAGLQLVACHSWANSHTWAAVLDSQVSDVGCHWEGAQYGQLLIRNSSNKAGGFVYDFSTMATGCGIQLGDAGATGGVPQTATVQANACDLRTRVSAFLNDTATRSALNWVSANQTSADLIAVTKTTGTYATTIAAGSNGVDLSTFTGGSPGTLNVASTQQIPSGPGTLTIATSNGNQTATFTGTNGNNANRTSGTQFTGVVAVGVPGGSTMSTGGAVSLSGIGSLAVGGATDNGSRIRVQAQSSTTALSTGASKVQEFGPHAYDVGSAANGWLLKVNGTQHVNYNSSGGHLQLAQGDDLQLYSDNFSTKTVGILGSTGVGTFTAVAASGLTGATAAARLVGAIASGTAPASGTFAAGDVLVVLTGGMIICTAGGTSGTWAALTPPATTPATPASFTPANPATTTSTSLVMMGLGSTCAYTPVSTGKVLATFCGLYLNTTSGDSVQFAGCYGTGTAPVNGAAQSGTLWGTGVGANWHPKSASTGLGVPFSFTQVLTLTANTAYWFDVALASDTAAAAAELLNITATLTETR